LFEKAVELDPGYHRAYAALATGHWRVAVSSWTAANVGMQRAFERMNANLAKAMEAPLPASKYLDVRPRSWTVSSRQT
jgi:hypothetical protein